MILLSSHVLTFKQFNYKLPVYVSVGFLFLDLRFYVVIGKKIFILGHEFLQAVCLTYADFQSQVEAFWLAIGFQLLNLS